MTKRFVLTRLAYILLFASTMLALNVETTLAQRSEAPETGSSGPRFWYREYCASCHGIDGTGNGPVAPTLNTKPTDLTLLARNNAGVFPEQVVRDFVDGTKAVPAHGTREMPVWGYPTTFQKGTLEGIFRPELSQEEINDRIRLIVSYVKVIQKK